MTPASAVAAVPAGTTAAAGETLTFTDVRVSVPTANGPLQILGGVTFDVPAGAVVALAGESGSGKSTAMLSVLRLLPWGAEVTGSIRYGEREVTALTARQLREFRARHARVIFQDPWSSLHPMHTLGQQLIESARSADPALSKRDARRLAVETLARVGLPDPDARMAAHPHQLSGGQLQRVMIAMALVARPTLLLCDEPTTALDVTTQAQILELLRELNRDMGLTVIIATHDLEVIADFADHLVVMYAGRVAEQGPVARMLAAPRHPYTWALLGAAPARQRGTRLLPIEGRPPRLDELPPGCAFAPRCVFAEAQCTETDPQPLLVDPATGHRTACVRVQQQEGRTA
ncbi:ABC transporter ATP-binding protein [Actinoplanes derwentensis]|uniref:Peptide/nickel transport system ATP-binding protein n=1 Tax=Actinoplanes derwentensis TaxID=113562 RepID=A0A1H1ZSZ0_9ACTN|nr:ABC transporter ATP-binding protein [Actinoplanes derwentensis]GID83566.1 hypothetical protein Ade03nite_24900 [Actinoplanes derwentensis]SDT36770.1 peptide/nickel transport system ATP-binding protein [Actinoplanes derwentensis]